MRRAFRVFSTAAVLAMTATGVTALAATPASAAPPNCNKYDYVRGTATLPRIPTYNGNPDCVMGYGNVSEGVWALQITLQRCYEQNVTPDRIFGTQTRAALANVQRRVGATPDGIYGPATRSRMKWAITGGLPGCQSVG